MSPLWFSEGRKKHVEVDDMNIHHAGAALAKLERGDYFDPEGNPPSVSEHALLRTALERRIAYLNAVSQEQEGTGTNE